MKNHPLRKIQGLERVPIPTLNIEVSMLEFTMLKLLQDLLLNDMR